MNVYLSKLCSRGIIDVNNNNVASQFIECDRCIMLINYKKNYVQFKNRYADKKYNKREI